MKTRQQALTFLQAAKAVLEEMKQPMHFKKITELAIQKKLLKSKGKTPEWTMGARLSVDLKEKGAKSDFIRTDNGKYGLRRWKRMPSLSLPVANGGKSADARRFWLVAVEPENFVFDEKSGKFDTVGVRHRMRRTLARISPGDQIVLYIKKSAQFGAILESVGETYIDDSDRWPKDGTELSARIAVKSRSVLDEKQRFDARPMYTELDVFSQYPAKHRTLALRNGITEINEADFERIKKAMAKAKKSR